jgi:hypothetical protein
MNAIFNINRFGYLLKRNAKASAKQIVYVAVTLIGLYAFAIVSYLSFNGIFDISLFAAFIVIFTPCAFESSINKQKSIFDFILPVSTFERFFYLLLKYVIIMPLICLAIVLIFQPILINIVVEDWALFKLQNIWHYQHFFEIFGAQAIVFLCYLYFKKQALLKSIMVITAIVLLSGLIADFSLLLNNISTVNISYTELFSPFNFVDKWTGATNIPIVICDIIFKIIFPFGLWILMFRKLKEIEI